MESETILKPIWMNMFLMDKVYLHVYILEGMSVSLMDYYLLIRTAEPHVYILDTLLSLAHEYISDGLSLSGFMHPKWNIQSHISIRKPTRMYISLCEEVYLPERINPPACGCTCVPNRLCIFAYISIDENKHISM